MPHYRKKRNWFAITLLLLATVFSVSLTSCAEIQKPEPEPFYAETSPPAKQEFRWSNGKTPKSFDPARAASAPETDIVRALFDGLTDIDAGTLKEVPAIAEKWNSSPDFRVWTFHLRKDARWSNGKRVTARDFVVSWKRLSKLGDKTAHRELFQNIVGLRQAKTTPLLPIDLEDTPVFGDEEPYDEKSNANSKARSPELAAQAPAANSAVGAKTEDKSVSNPSSEKMGAKAIDETTLRVTLERPDKDFPKLVANPIFRPVYGDGSTFERDRLSTDVVTNGPFTIASVGKDGILLNRSDSYWNKAAVNLEQVRFVSKENAEAALSAYKQGEIDALTNAEFEPLAVKLLSPYDDFRQTTHSALNFYEFNTKNAPFSDRRVREALAISIDRDRITDGELERTARPALSYLPLSDKKDKQLSFDVQKAKQLIDAAGFANGANFPKIRLLINRNDTQHRVARAVAQMWKQNLNLDTEIIVKELSAIDAARTLGEYDLVRRGVVIATTDEAAGIAAIFGVSKKPETSLQGRTKSETRESDPAKPLEHKSDELPADLTDEGNSDSAMLQQEVLTEVDAMSELNAIPLYFPMAYALVKPYVRGFQVNGLDATALEEVSIDSSWQPKIVKGAS